MSTAAHADRAHLQTDLSAMYEKLERMHLKQHAKDFWLQRAQKQRADMLKDPLLHEHTALKQYISWHSPTGMRLPNFFRNTAKCVAQQP
jgi:hypothetical protein